MNSVISSESSHANGVWAILGKAEAINSLGEGLSRRERQITWSKSGAIS